MQSAVDTLSSFDQYDAERRPDEQKYDQQEDAVGQGR
jgi:hypothetical protein